LWFDVLGAVADAAVVGVGVERGSSWCAGSASGVQLPAADVGVGVGAVLEAELGAVERPSSSLSGSSALMRPSPSVSAEGLGSAPSITPSSSLSASFGSVPRKTLDRR
jgi:hypothetical protein